MSNVTGRTNRLSQAWSSRWALGACALLFIVGCSSSKWAGDWNGDVKQSASQKKAKGIGFSETKVSLNATLKLNGDGSYVGKFQEVAYTGDWKDEGQKITLTPKTYMGMTEENFPKPKKDTSAGAVDSLFKPYVLDESTDGKTLTHTDDRGTTTFSKAN